MNIFGKKVPQLKKAARRMLLSELSAVLLAAVALLISYLAEAECDPILAALHFADGPVYILASLALAVSTSLLCDLALRRGEH
ncbi:MAG TPA: hypothetical protein DDW30_01005 [Clostridiales bacterium]|nr:hypothetical protein [Clostridiales bacterium]